MASELPVQTPPSFPKRRGWLIAFGVVEILIACFFLLALIGIYVAFVHLGDNSMPPPNAMSKSGMLILSTVIYGGLAALFVTSAVGSILCKNWARIVMLVVSALWLGLGFVSTVFVWLVFPYFMQQQDSIPPEGRHTVLVVMVICMSLFMVLLPAVFLWFYSRKSVKATCLYHGRTSEIAAAELSTFGIPVPVVILAIYQGLGMFAVFALLFAKSTVLFGHVLHGFWALLVLLTYSIVSGYAAWAIYQRKFAGWAIVLFYTIFGLASAIVTLTTHDIMQIYREMGISERQLEIFQQQPQLLHIAWWMAVPFMVIVLGFIWYTKKFFVPTPNIAGN
jgi:hypothetical protein